MLLDGRVKILPTCLAAIAMVASLLHAEVVIEYDAEKQGYPDGLEKLDKKTVADGVCIMAEAQLSMGEVHDFRFFGQLFPLPFRYAVVGEEKRSVAIKPIASDRLETKSIITVVMGKKSITAFELMMPEPGESPVLPDEIVEVGQKLDNIDEFNRLIKTSMDKSDAAGEVARAVLVVDTKTPFGEMIDTLKLIQTAGCEHGLVIMGDHFAAAFNILGMDPEVKPPIARNAMVQQDEEGRIVVNVRNEMDAAIADIPGHFIAEDLSVLETERAIKICVQKAREEIEKQGIKPRLYLRGDKEALFKHVRVALRAAAAAGVHQVLFATYVREQDVENETPDQAELQVRPKAENPRLFEEGHRSLISLIEPREYDLGFRLPSPAAKPNKAPEIDPFIITIKGDGSTWANGEPMDMDDSSRELPRLDAVLGLYRNGVDAVDENALVEIYATDDVQHQRVIDVLNSLARARINSVTFTDLTKEDE